MGGESRTSTSFGPAQRRGAWLGAAVALAHLLGPAAALRPPAERRTREALRLSRASNTSEWELLPWDAAWSRARATAAQLSQEEQFGLVRGVHYNVGVGGGDAGWYVGNTLPIERLAVPALKMQDAGQGFRVTPPGVDGTSTSWPCMLALAATWDETLVHRVAQSVANEFASKGANTILGPSINVHRVAKNGRNFEYISGEDPYLGARLAAAHVRGLQSQGVMAVAKHFAFNEQETNRMSENSVVDAKTAWELYYPPFQASVDAGLSSVMCAYNRVNGTYMSENADVLVRDLQNGMGFQGFVMSDWTATHTIQAIDNGLSMDMPGIIPGLPVGIFTDGNLEQVSPAVVSGAVERILASLYHMRLDEQQGPVACVPPSCIAEIMSNVTSDEHSALARTAATRAVTLLKNEGGILPIRPERVRTIAVLGVAADAAGTPAPMADYYAGGGSGKVAGAAEITTPLQGISRRAAEAGITVLSNCTTQEEMLQLARAADLAIVVGATTSSEGTDRMTLSMDWAVDETISQVAAVNPQTVVLMQTPGAVLTPWRDEVPGIAHVFLAGVETGTAWSSVLFGDVEPTGRLPIMMPESEADTISPIILPDVVYSEGLFTSYRNPNFRAAFPFGFGLAYTSFEYGAPQELTGDACQAAACVRVRITNTGSRSGSEVVQAYLHYPGDDTQPQRVLKNFARTASLAPGASEEVALMFTEKDLSVYSVGDGWVRANDIDVHIGSSSQDIKGELSLVRSR